MPFWFQNRTGKVDKSKVLRLCAVVPVADEAWNVWHRLITAKGVDVMPGNPNLMNNSIHGEINTMGCWMLFRNYNWPKAKFDDFEVAFRKFYRNQMDDEYRIALASLGYETNGVCGPDNRNKALFWDKNYAYTRFTRHVVGVKYFTENRFDSLYNVDGEHFDATATKAYFDARLPRENAHDFTVALGKSMPGFSSSSGLVRAPDSLFDDSRLGFVRQQRWAPTLTREQVSRPLECSWADVVLFR
ncbi:MAG: hypothetical protein QM784_31820 [Polyangiaceae bacterium]